MTANNINSGFGHASATFEVQSIADGSARTLTNQVVVRFSVGEKDANTTVTIYDQFTGEPVCVLSENKALALKEGKCGE